MKLVLLAFSALFVTAVSAQDFKYQLEVKVGHLENEQHGYIDIIINPGEDRTKIKRISMNKAGDTGLSEGRVLIQTIELTTPVEDINGVEGSWIKTFESIPDNSKDDLLRIESVVLKPMNEDGLIEESKTKTFISDEGFNARSKESWDNGSYKGVFHLKKE